MPIATAGYCRVSVLVLAVLGAGQEEPVRRSPLTVPDTAEGEIILEWVASREAVPGSARDSLSLGPPGAGTKRALTWGTGGDKSVPLEDLLFLKLPGTISPNGVAPMTFFMRDGSEILGSVSPPPDAPAAGAPPGDVIFVHSPGLSSSPLRLSIDALKGLLVHDPLSALKKAEPRIPASPRSAANLRLRGEILRSTPAKDTLVFLEEGRAQGVLDSIAPEGVKFSSEGLGDVRVAFDKLRALLLSDLEQSGKKPASSVREPGQARVTLRDGTSLEGKLIEIRGGAVSMATESLGSIKVALRDLLEIAFLGGRLSYLSDRDPVRVDERLPAAYTANSRPYQRDLSVMESAMRLGGREYRKGLGVHAYSLLEYDLGGAYSRFQATIGLDESARPSGSRITGAEGSVVFRVKMDGKLLLEKLLTWRDPGEAIDLSVAGGKTLQLEVDCGKPLDASSVFNFALDRADWAEARLIQ